MRYVGLCFVVLCVFVSFGASALTGSGASPVTPLDTVSPTLESAAAVTTASVAATFSEPMRAPGVTDAGNYAVSGLGVGTLAPAPSDVSGGPSVVMLDWAAGEMRDSVSLTLMVSGVQDAVGNPINPTANSASFAGKGTPPVFSNLQVMPAQASAGDIVTITFTVSEPLQEDPEVTVNGRVAMRGSDKSVDYTYIYEVEEPDVPGMAMLHISGADLAGNLGALSNNTVLEILEATPALPLFGWPWLAALLLALGFMILWRKGHLLYRSYGSYRSYKSYTPFFALLFACSLAFAQAPTVTNVTLTQSPTATSTQVDIHYDLVAPNGPCDITVTLSKDGGDDGYPHPVTSITGDLSGVTTGTGKHILWDIRADYPEEDLPLARVLVTADDGVVQYTLTYLAGANGSISGPTPQTVNHGNDGAQVIALPDPHHDFVQWDDGVLTAARTDTNITSNLTVTALFAINSYDITCNVVGNGTCVADPATVNHGDTSDITVNPATGWHLVSLVDSEEGAKPGSYTTTPVTTDRTVTATFALNQYAVDFVTDGTPGATLDGDVNQTVDHGGDATEVTALEPASHSFMRWTLGGAEYATTPAITVTNVTGPMTLTAEYAINTYTLNYLAGANGSISGTTPQTVNHGADGAQVTAVGDGAYVFNQWSDGSTQNPRTDMNVTENITVTASFVNVPPVVTSFAINSGAATTTNPVVTLNNTCVGSPTQYMASESPTFSGASWLAYGTGPSFTLSAGTGGTKTVYFKVRNASGESAPVSDTIDLVERTILLPGSVPLVLRWIPSGSFQMGRYPGEANSYTREDPQHLVTLAYGFWMGKYEVTQQQWIAVRGSWPGTAPSAMYGLGNTYPAYYISWNDAKNFITSLNAHIVSSGQGPLTVRLPSEAEWEYACRAGTSTRFYFGDSQGCAADCSDCAAGTLPGNRTAYMWYCGNISPDGSKAVGGKTANAFGLYDMSGNVWEWCEDDYHGSYTGAPADGSAWVDSPRASERMFRGGSWVRNAGDCRSAFRFFSSPGARYDDFGFRLAAVQ